MQYRVQQVGDEQVQYLRAGHGRSLLFLHGFGLPPEHHEEMIGRLAEHYDVIAPSLCGMNYLKTPPSNIEDLAKFTIRFCDALGLESYDLVGHSLGGAVAMRVASISQKPRRLVLMNPVCPVKYGYAGFLWRAICKHVAQACDTKSGRKGIELGVGIVLPYLKNFFKKMTGLALVREMMRFSYNAIHVPQQTLLLCGTDDEYFDLRKHVAELRSHIPDMTVREFAYNHDWPLLHPDIAASEAVAFLVHDLSIDRKLEDTPPGIGSAPMPSPL